MTAQIESMNTQEGAQDEKEQLKIIVNPAFAGNDQYRCAGTLSDRHGIRSGKD